jgi:acetyl-CoA carboxylase biotin carboxyl carrier protein
MALVTDGKADAVSAAAGEDSLLTLIDRLAAMVDDAGLSELEVEVGGTVVALRSPAALAMSAAAPPATAVAGSAIGGPGPDETPRSPTVRAPLTGIWYASPTPGSAPYVSVGAEIGAGQVIGLIEAMKLFNEIKSDLAGRVTRIMAENGQLVKARQSLIEVEPL